MLGNLSMLQEYEKALESKTSNTGGGGGTGDPRMVQFQTDKTYKFKLLFWVPTTTNQAGQQVPTDRKDPLIGKYIHTFSDEATNTYDRIVCPTSLHEMGSAGFKECPICAFAKNAWNDGEKPGSTSKDLYYKFGRKFNGHALVYVIEDPTTPANNGTVKIMRFGIKMHRFFQRAIFGRDAKGAPTGEEKYGMNAFNLVNSFDLVIPVTPSMSGDKKYNNYDEIKFSMSPNTIVKDTAELIAEIEALNFDRDFYQHYNAQDTAAFNSAHIIGNTVDTSEKANGLASLGEAVQEMTPLVATPAVQNTVPTPAVQNTVATPAVQNTVPTPAKSAVISEVLNTPSDPVDFKDIMDMFGE